MKIICLIQLILFSYLSYSQDQIKLWNQSKPLTGKVIIIRNSTVEFQDISTGFLYEINNSDIDYVISEKGDTIWFSHSDEKFKLGNPVNKIKTLYNSDDNVKRLTLFFSYNFSGDHQVSFIGSSGSLDVNAAISLGAELDAIKIARDAVKLGIGVIYQFPRKQKMTDGDFNFIPIFAFLKLGIVNEQGFDGKEKLKVYIFPTLGYNIFNGDDEYTGGFELEGGLYNSIGLGMLVGNKLDVKLLYQFNRGSVVVNDKEAEIIYKSFGLQCGYYF